MKLGAAISGDYSSLVATIKECGPTKNVFAKNTVSQIAFDSSRQIIQRRTERLELKDRGCLSQFYGANCRSGNGKTSFTKP